MITDSGSAFFSGAGHVFYALIISAGVSLAVLTGMISAEWLSIVLFALGGIFADLWAHGYTH